MIKQLLRIQKDIIRSSIYPLDELARVSRVDSTFEVTIDSVPRELDSVIGELESISVDADHTRKIVSLQEAG